MSTPADDRPPTGGEGAPAPSVSTAPATDPGHRWWSAIPHHLGRARTSTVALSVLFVAIFALYSQVKPEEGGTAETGSVVPAAPTTTVPVPTTTAPPTTGPETTTEPTTGPTTGPTTEDEPTATTTPPPTTSRPPAPTTTPTVQPGSPAPPTPAEPTGGSGTTATTTP